MRRCMSASRSVIRVTCSHAPLRVGAVVLVRDGRRTRRQMEGVGRDLAQSVVARWDHTDADTAAMLKLNRTMVRLTWAVVVLTVVVLGATLYVGLR